MEDEDLEMSSLEPSVNTWPVEHPSVLSLFRSFCPGVQGLGALSERVPRAEGKDWGLTSATSLGHLGCFSVLHLNLCLKAGFCC